MMTTLSKNLRIIAASAVLTLGAGAVTDAFAAPIFKVDPNSISGVTTGTVFSADFISGHSSARVVNTSGNDYTSVGWIQFDGFSNNGVTTPVGQSRLNLDYGLYATFTQTFACPGALGVGVTCGVTGINLNVYADIFSGGATGDTFANATLLADPTVTDGGPADTLLATANIVYSGVAGLNPLGGAHENVNTNFALNSPAGTNFFIDPVPFYNLAFSEFNNTSVGIACSPNCTAATVVAITGESGGTQFGTVPEPATLALMGLGLLGIAGSLRRRKV